MKVYDWESDVFQSTCVLMQDSIGSYSQRYDRRCLFECAAV